MVKARTWFTLFLISLGTIAATASCGSSDEGTGATAGASGVGGGGLLPGAGRAGGSVGRAGSGGGGVVGPAGTGLGAACKRDADCADGLTCATAGGGLFGGDGPSGGMCTLSCARHSDCEAFEAGSACFNVGTDADPVGFCMQACVEGDPGADLSVKCQGRTDFVCINYDRTATDSTFCSPLCRSNAECGSNLFCNKHTGLCSKTKPPKGDPVGAACDPAADVDTCEGVCLATDADGLTGACVELCAGGFDCMLNGTKPGGLCAGPLTDPDVFSALDFGYCLPNCSCTGDCKLPGDLCRKWAADEAATAKFLGADGLCFPELVGSTELTCGEGGAGGEGGAPASGGSAGHGGATAGTGGATAGSGGSAAGSGGAAAGTGGAPAASAGTGGASGGVSGGGI